LIEDRYRKYRRIGSWETGAREMVAAT